MSWEEEEEGTLKQGDFHVVTHVFMHWLSDMSAELQGLTTAVTPTRYF